MGQLRQNGSGLPTGEQGAVGLHGEGVQHRPGPFQFGGRQDGFRLRGVHQGLRRQQVRPAVQQTVNLPPVILHQFVKIRLVEAVHVHGQGGQISGHQSPLGGAAGQGHQSRIDGFRLIAQIHPFQGDGLGLKCWGVEDVAACLPVGLLQGPEGFRVVQHPFLRAAAPGHPGLHEIGAGGSVENQGTGGEFGL